MAAIVNRPDYVSGERAAIEHIQYDVDRSRRASVMRHNQVLIRQSERARRRQNARIIFISPVRFAASGFNNIVAYFAHFAR